MLWLHCVLDSSPDRRRWVLGLVCGLLRRLGSQRASEQGEVEGCPQNYLTLREDMSLPWHTEKMGTYSQNAVQQVKLKKLTRLTCTKFAGDSDGRGSPYYTLSGERGVTGVGVTGVGVMLRLDWEIIWASRHITLNAVFWLFLIDYYYYRSY